MKKIILKNICKQYTKNHIVFKNLNLTINNTDFIGITGKSGSGKSTLLKILGMFDSNYLGEYYINDIHLNNKNNKNKLSFNRNKYIGYISQDYNLIDNFSVFNNIALPLMLRNAKLEEITNDVKAISQKFNIEHLLDKPTIKLSGGERQRVCIARALIGNPSIIIADEPTASLDKENTAIIIRYLKEINKTSSIILASHDDNIINVCDRVYSINNKRLELKTNNI